MKIICSSLVILLLSVTFSLAQTNPGFVDGAPLCADYPNPICQSTVPMNPLSLNQAFMNKMDVTGASGPVIGDGTISGLPICNSGLIGTRTYITNGQNNPAWLSIVLTAPTGSTVAPVFCNGTNWVYG
jgi:hypothetical protein